MAQKNEIIKSRNTSPANTAIIGALVGAGAGVVAAMLLHRRAKKQSRESMVSASEVIQLGLLIFGLFRAISAMGDDE